MSSRILPWASAGVLCLALILAWLNFGGVVAGKAASKESADLPDAALREEQHFVTPQQLVETAVRIPAVVADFRAITSEGRPTSWKDVSAGRPLVVIFIRDGCPCSVRFEPIFHRLETELRSGVQFVGVIDGTVEAAREYARKNDVPYPLLADPEHRLIDLFQAKNAAYVALVDRKGSVDSLWPGCSAEMMRELNRKAARLAGQMEPVFCADGMPGPLTTGCPFEKPRAPSF